MDPFNKNKTQDPVSGVAGGADTSMPAPATDEPTTTDPVVSSSQPEPVVPTVPEPDVAAPPAPPDEPTGPAMGGTTTPGMTGGGTMSQDDSSQLPVTGTQDESPTAPLGQPPAMTEPDDTDEGTGGGTPPVAGQ